MDWKGLNGRAVYRGRRHPGLVGMTGEIVPEISSAEFVYVRFQLGSKRARIIPVKPTDLEPASSSLA